MPKFIVWRLWSIYFDHHLPLKPFIGKRRKQSCTPNILRFCTRSNSYPSLPPPAKGRMTFIFDSHPPSSLQRSTRPSPSTPPPPVSEAHDSHLRLSSPFFLQKSTSYGDWDWFYNTDFTNSRGGVEVSRAPLKQRWRGDENGVRVEGKSR